MQREKYNLKDSGVILTEDHIYWLGDKQLSGITSAIGNQLFPDKYSNVPDSVLRDAAKRGTAIHEAIQAYDMFGIAYIDEAKEYARLKEQHGFEIIDSEYIVSDYKNFATPIDKVMVFPDTEEGTVDLGDIKNTYSLDKEYLSWQLSINKYLFNIVNPDIKVGKFYAIWTRNGVSLHEIDEIPQEEVVELLNCEVNGEQYIRKNILTKINSNEVEIAQQMSDMVVAIAEMQKKHDEFKEQLLNIFESYGVDKWETDLFTISRVKGYDRETFDSKRFKADEEELYNQYTKVTRVKPSVKIKLK